MVRDYQVPLTASLGVALIQCGPDTDLMEFVREADQAMYEAKKAAARTTWDPVTF